MAYIRAKKVKGIDYAYLVKSEWDEKRKTSRQVTIRYLGRASDVEIEDMPEEYRGDPRILAFLSKHSRVESGKKTAMIESLCAKLSRHLMDGDVGSALNLYRESRAGLSLAEFYDKVFRRIMYDIGKKWEDGEIDVATEHVASNAAMAVIASIQRIEAVQRNTTRGQVVVLCCPDGELHCIPALVLESVLKSKGYSVINASPSIPAGSIVHYIDDKKPDLVMVSITLPENVGAAKRLVGDISSKLGIPVLVGGSALAGFKGDFPGGATISPSDDSLEDVIRRVRSTLSATPQTGKRW